MGGCANKNIIEAKIFKNYHISEAEIKILKKLKDKVYSKEVFKTLNIIRKNIDKYSKLIDKILTMSPTDDPYDISIENYTLSIEDTKLVHFFQNYIDLYEDKKKTLKELLDMFKEVNSSFCPQIKWSELGYKILSSSSLQENLNLNNKISEDIREKVNEAFKKNIKEILFCLDCYCDPFNAVWMMLIENREKFNEIIKDSYMCGCVVTFVDKEYNFLCCLVFFNETESEVVIDGVNRFTGEYEPMYLDEDIFENIEYKEMIVEGNYYYCEDNRIHVVFKLVNGEIREENIDFF